MPYLVGGVRVPVSLFQLKVLYGCHPTVAASLCAWSHNHVQALHSSAFSWQCWNMAQRSHLDRCGLAPRWPDVSLVEVMTQANLWTTLRLHASITIPFPPPSPPHLFCLQSHLVSMIHSQIKHKHAESGITRTMATLPPLDASIPYHSMHIMSRFPYFMTPMTCCYDLLALIRSLITCSLTMCTDTW